MLPELLALLAAMIIQVIIPPIPAELITAAAGNQYGVALTTLFAGSGLFIGSVLVYAIGRKLSTLAVFDQENVQDVLERLREHEQPILWVRILPYNPADVISYAAGIAVFDLKTYLTITFIASYARSSLLAWLGTQAQTLWSIIGVLAVLAVSAYVGYKLTYGARGARRRAS